MNNDGSKQSPPQGAGRENEIGSLLAAASDFARSVLESVQALAGTTACKGDAVPNNVLMGADGHLYFIDTIIFQSGTGGQETYQSLSPRARK